MLPNQPPHKLMHDFVNVSKLILLFALSLLVAGCATVDPQYEPWPKDARTQAHVDLALIYLERGQISVAKEEFSNALNIDDQSDQALHGLGLIEVRALNFDKARSLMAKAYAINNKNIKVAGDYGILLCQSGDIEAGIKLLEDTQANSLDSNTVGINLALGRCYQSANQNGDAAQALGRVLLLSPTLPQALFSMAQVRYDQNEVLSARAFIQRYFAANAISSEALLLGAQIEGLLGNVERRNSYTKTLRERYPQSKAWQQATIEFN